MSILKDDNIRFQQEISFNEDFLFVLDFLGKAKKICIHNEILVHYWIEEVKDSLSSKKTLEEIILSGQMLSRSMYTLKMNKVTKKKVNYELCHHILIAVHSMIKGSSPKEKRKMLKKVTEETFFKEGLKNMQIDQWKKKIKMKLLKLKWFGIYLLIAERGVNK